LSKNKKRRKCYLYSNNYFLIYINKRKNKRKNKRRNKRRNKRINNMTQTCKTRKKEFNSGIWLAPQFRDEKNNVAVVFRMLGN